MFKAPEEIAVEVVGSANRAVQAASWTGLTASEDEAGLYTWWVDGEGAELLSHGLGETVQQGLIYGGQAGATRWPSGTKSNQTLNGRIGSNHLGGSIRGSTFRRTLAVLLLEQLKLDIVPDRKAGLSSQSEAELSQWMQTHLSVVLWPFADRDALGAIEEKVLLKLDPPLNLRGLPKTRLRNALSRARKELSAVAKSRSPIAEKKLPASDRKRSACAVTLHEEISDILIEEGNRWMTCTEIAEHVNARGRYRKRNKTAVTSYQVHGRTRNYSKIFDRDGQRVCLLSV